MTPWKTLNSDSLEESREWLQGRILRVAPRRNRGSGILYDSWRKLSGWLYEEVPRVTPRWNPDSGSRKQSWKWLPGQFLEIPKSRAP